MKPIENTQTHTHARVHKNAQGKTSRTVGIAAVATPPGLGVVEGHVVPVVVRLREARVAQHARFVRLAGPAHPDDVVLAERVLADPPRDHPPGQLERPQGRRAVGEVIVIIRIVLLPVTVVVIIISLR